MAENARKMIRFDDDDDDSDDTVAGSDNERPPVMPHYCEEYCINEQQGLRYQKCGGGRRRMPKRAN